MFGRSTRTLTFLTGALLLLGAGCSSGDVSPSATVSALATSESSTRVESSPTGQSSTTTTDPATGSSGNDRVTIADLLASAEVPARCDMPKQTLINGATDPSFSPRSGWLILDDGVGPIAADLNGDGNQELVVRFGCTAGGVGWPELLLVYTPAHGSSAMSTSPNSASESTATSLRGRRAQEQSAWCGRATTEPALA
ncbi:hypothetical protein [Nostocoides jenkinsii]|uniref:Uncharacterized protein n=1 Tax=Nostocoides jenkinsii Ben 74 TaxID=1193518 RepID=A0A077MDN1_9MICO|nr:hypothetical protein [Tetrasphaera jenkinsii]CCI54015.1 exported hypothetical protein [Tetrasphaera jenkinsii Ben 74]